jgi:hypothetical protein
VASRPTRDRGQILHLAGRLRLSPAVRGGRPALVAPGDQDGRCGWDPFFAALERGGLWVSEDEGGTVHLVRRGAERSR